MKDSITENIKIDKHIHTELQQHADEAEEQRSFELLAKGNALKRKSQDETNRLEKALQVLQGLERRSCNICVKSLAHHILQKLF